MIVDPTPERDSFAAQASRLGLPLLGELEVSLPRPGVAAVALKGEHDLSTEAELRSLLQMLVADQPLVLVDVTDAEFIDSSVIHTLMLADREARALHHRFVLVAGTAPFVNTALRISGVIDYLECAGSVEEALSAS